MWEKYRGREEFFLGKGNFQKKEKRKKEKGGAGCCERGDFLGITGLRDIFSHHRIEEGSIFFYHRMAGRFDFF